MIKTVIIIVLSVSIFGILFFVVVKNALKKRLTYLLKENKKKIKINYNILQNFLNSSLGISKTLFDTS